MHPISNNIALWNFILHYELGCFQFTLVGWLLTWYLSSYVTNGHKHGYITIVYPLYALYTALYLIPPHSYIWNTGGKRAWFVKQKPRKNVQKRNLSEGRGSEGKPLPCHANVLVNFLRSWLKYTMMSLMTRAASIYLDPEQLDRVSGFMVIEKKEPFPRSPKVSTRMWSEKVKQGQNHWRRRKNMSHMGRLKRSSMKKLRHKNTDLCVMLQQLVTWQYMYW